MICKKEDTLPCVGVATILLSTFVGWAMAYSYDNVVNIKDVKCENLKVYDSRIVPTSFNETQVMEVVTKKGTLTVEGRHSFGTQTTFCSNKERMFLTDIRNRKVIIK
jgi:hypothetical protein